MLLIFYLLMAIKADISFHKTRMGMGVEMDIIREINLNNNLRCTKKSSARPG